MFEFFTGTTEEHNAQRRIYTLIPKQESRKLNPREERTLTEARNIRRRLVRRRIVVAGGGLVATAVLVPQAWNLLSRDPDESVYQDYLSSFAQLASGDEEATNVLAFVRERRRKGKIENGLFKTLDTGNPTENFYTAIVDSRQTLFGYNAIEGFSSYRHSSTPTVLFLKRAPITPIWAGAIFGHEGLHAYQWLMGIEYNRPDGFMAGEQEAYDLEFRLLNNASSGRFRQAVEEMIASANPPSEGYIIRIHPPTLTRLNGVFGNPRGIDEDAVRYGGYLTALNYALIDHRQGNSLMAKSEKIEYIRGVFERRIPFLR